MGPHCALSGPGAHHPPLLSHCLFQGRRGKVIITIIIIKVTDGLDVIAVSLFEINYMRNTHQHQYQNNNHSDNDTALGPCPRWLL